MRSIRAIIKEYTPVQTTVSALLMISSMQAAGRMRSITAASKSADLAASLASGHQLSQDDYRVLIAIQFWLNRDHQQLLQTIAAMRAAGHDLDQTVLLQVRQGAPGSSSCPSISRLP